LIEEENTLRLIQDEIKKVEQEMKDKQQELE